jgi:hypothetical protein
MGRGGSTCCWNKSFLFQISIKACVLNGKNSWRHTSHFRLNSSAFNVLDIPHGAHIKTRQELGLKITLSTRNLTAPDSGHVSDNTAFEKNASTQRNFLGWVHTCNVTAYRNTVSWQCRRNSCTRNVSKVGYAVTLRTFLVCCRYLAVASKGWYG